MFVPSWTLKVTDVVAETVDAVTIVFEPPPVAGETSYHPGQFLTLRIPSDETGYVARCYSLSSCPSTDTHLAVTVKRTAGGYASNWLCDNVCIGDQLDVLPPSGAFTPASLDGDLLLLAAGSGITPIFSIVRSALAQPGGHVVLVYANRDAESVIFGSALRDLLTDHPHRMRVVHWLEALQGRPSEASLTGLLAPYAHHDAFICGPAPFMTAARHALEALGAPRSQIHVEKFVSLSGDPFAPRQQVSQEGLAGTTLVVKLAGRSHTLPWSRDRTLIELLIDHHIEAPYSCLEGDCGTCQCVLVSGEVDMDHRGALDDQDVADGILLGCQARPASDRIEIEF